jgi:hypothetical protein
LLKELQRPAQRLKYPAAEFTSSLFVTPRSEIAIPMVRCSLLFRGLGSNGSLHVLRDCLSLPRKTAFIEKAGTDNETTKRPQSLRRGPVRALIGKPILPAVVRPGILSASAAVRPILDDTLAPAHGRGKARGAVEPEILAPWRLHDAARYKIGLAMID